MPTRLDHQSKHAGKIYLGTINTEIATTCLAIELFDITTAKATLAKIGQDYLGLES